MNYQNWISGLPQQAKNQVSFERADGQKASRPESDFLDIVNAVKSANESLQQVAKKKLDGFELREKILIAIETRLRGRSQAMADRIFAAEGVPLHIVRDRQIPRAAAAFSQAARWVKQQPIHCHSAGLVGILTSPYDALTEIGSRLAAALAAGCAVIVKPSPSAPQSAHEIFEVISEVLAENSLPPGIINLIHGGEDTGINLCEHPAIATISVSALTDDAWRIAGQCQQAAPFPFGKRLHIVRPGLNSVILNCLPTSDQLNDIFQALVSIHDLPFLRAGRLFVTESAMKPVLERLKDLMEKPAIEIGPLLTNRDQEAFRQFIDQAAQDQGRPVSAGLKCYAVSEMTLCSTLHQTEILAPVFTVNSFKYIHDAVQKMANSTQWGGVAYIFDDDVERAKRTALRLDAGLVFINHTPHNSAAKWADLEWIPNKSSGLNPIGIQALAGFFSKQVKIDMKE